MVKCPPSLETGQPMGLLCDYVTDENQRVVEDNIWYQNEFCKKCWEKEKDSSSLIENLREFGADRSCIPHLKGKRLPSENYVIMISFPLLIYLFLFSLLFLLSLL